MAEGNQRVSTQIAKSIECQASIWKVLGSVSGLAAHFPWPVVKSQGFFLFSIGSKPLWLIVSHSLPKDRDYLSKTKPSYTSFVLLL